MKPKTISLPDDLRDALEEVLKPIPKDIPLKDGKPDSDAESALREKSARTVCNLLFSSPPLAGETFSGTFCDALLDMETGNGSPAVVLENLPPSQGQFFIAAMAQILGPRMDSAAPSIDDPGHGKIFSLHRDIGRFSGKKHIRILYCKTAGALPVPTIFATLDEAIHAHVCLTLNPPLPVNSTKEDIEAKGLFAEYGTLRNDFIEQLKSSPRFGMQDNPNYTPHNHAPQYISNCLSFPGDDNPKVNDDLRAAYKALRTLAAEQSTACTKDNTAVFWNNHLVAHDRAAPVQADRQLVSYTVRPSFDTQENEPGMLSGAIAPPCALVTFPVQEGVLQAAMNAPELVTVQ